jgi:hypothetical protein
VSRADDLRAEYEVAVQVAELEDELAALKSGGDPVRLRDVKNELRALRHVLRLGRQSDDASVAELAAIRALAEEN